MVTLAFDNVQSPGVPLTDKYQLLLGVEARFQLSVGSLIVLTEPHFSIVELRQWLQHWMDTGANDDFSYTSLEAEEQGLVTFRRRGISDCAVGSAWSDLETEPITSWCSVVQASAKYIRDVDSWVAGHLGVSVVEVLGDLR